MFADPYETMKKSTHAVVRKLRVSWWTWVPLIPLLAGCSKPAPRELVCEPIAIFEALGPEQDAGTAPFSIERLGPEVSMEALKTEPTSVTFTGDNRAIISWQSFGHMYSESDVIYSPAEGLARVEKYPKTVYPMKRFSDGKSERVRLGYRSKVCRQPDEKGGYAFCKYSEDMLLLVVDMICRSK